LGIYDCHVQDIEDVLHKRQNPVRPALPSHHVLMALQQAQRLGDFKTWLDTQAVD